jgi:hypothetical protein
VSELPYSTIGKQEKNRSQMLLYPAKMSALSVFLDFLLETVKKKIVVYPISPPPQSVLV